MQQAHDFLEEAATLAGLLEKQPEQVFDKVTLFKSWTINDVIGHLYMFDVAALKTLESARAFETFFAPIKASLREGKSLLETQFPYLGDIRGRALFDTWLANTEVLGQAYALADPKQRVSWAGPEMSALSSITARQMETWAHGHEVFDALGEQRKEGDSIKNICHLGVSTFAWTFLNRRMDIPEPIPYVELTAPSGQIWTWNEPKSYASIRGSAVEFAQVVTQVRSFDDTMLQAIGLSAQAWMSMAQCFAGKPERPPQKGSRYRV
tara:strand:+ start:214 stop:1008 length:795 start_codon:yes stop_codon:yes gene_type:complete